MSRRVPAATWIKVIEENGIPQTQSGVVKEDPFATLTNLSEEQQKMVGVEAVRVAMTLSNASSDYSRVRVTVTIEVSSPQHEDALNLAAEACFIKVRDMINEAAQALEIEELP